MKMFDPTMIIILHHKKKGILGGRFGLNLVAKFPTPQEFIDT
jgi:hypothetical protein